jgi:class 3 adenylate cyclase
MTLLLQRLRWAGVSTLGLDFVYAEAREPEVDSRLAAELRASRGIIAERFQPRSGFSLSLETVNLADETERSFPAPLPLFEPIAAAARERGILNIISDFDGTIRYLPLGYRMEPDDQFRPSLGFAMYVQTICDTLYIPNALLEAACASWPAREVPPGVPASPALVASSATDDPPATTTIPAMPVAPTAPDNNSDAATALGSVITPEMAKTAVIQVLNQAPYAAGLFGNSGIDWYLRRREAEAVLEHLLRRRDLDDDTCLSLRDELRQMLKPVDLPPRSFVPSWPRMPLFGSRFAPLVRLVFAKVEPPLTGDGIRTLSMSRFLQPDFPRGDDRLTIDRENNDDQLTESLGFRFAEAGTGSLRVGCRDPWGRPLASGTPVLRGLVCERESGYWATATADLDGTLEFSSLPPGTYAVELWAKRGGGVVKMELERSVSVSSGEPRTETALIQPFAGPVTVAVPAASGSRTLIGHGDGVWVLELPADARLPYDSVPPGFALSRVEDGEPLQCDPPSLVVTSASGTPQANVRVALLEEQPTWKTTFAFQVPVPLVEGEIAVDSVCPALGAQFAVISAGDLDEKPVLHECDLLWGQHSRLMIASSASAHQVPRRCHFAPAPGSPQDTRVLLLTAAADWVETPASAGLPLLLKPGSYRVFGVAGTRRGTFSQVRSLCADRAVLLGTTLLEDQDFYTTPVNFLDQHFKHIPGVNLHAQLYSALRRGDFFSASFLHPDRALGATGLLVLLLLFPLIILADELFRRKGGLAGGFMVLGIMIAWYAASRLSFQSRVLVPLTLPLLSCGLYGLFRGYQAYLDEKERESRTRSTFGRFVSAAMVHELLKNPDAVKPGGEKKPLTVMFTDLAGFTSISELLKPEELVVLMNEYLGEMTKILFAHGGTLDKYIGDAIMGFWNHPTPQHDHPLRACRCAIAMQRQLVILRERWKKQGYPAVSMRAGMNTCEAVVGLIGSEIQMNFTCLGDGVNLAARLEGANKAYHTFMMISQAVRDELPATIRTRFLDFLAVKGKAIPMKVYELIGEKGEDDALWEQVLPLYDQGIAHYLKKEWDLAIAAFNKVCGVLPQDGPSLTYIERCETYKIEPPPDNWDGSYILNTK